MPRILNTGFASQLTLRLRPRQVEMPLRREVHSLLARFLGIADWIRDPFSRPLPEGTPAYMRSDNANRMLPHESRRRIGLQRLGSTGGAR